MDAHDRYFRRLSASFSSSYRKAKILHEQKYGSKLFDEVLQDIEVINKKFAKSTLTNSLGTFIKTHHDTPTFQSYPTFRSTLNTWFKKKLTQKEADIVWALLRKDFERDTPVCEMFNIICEQIELVNSVLFFVDSWSSKPYSSEFKTVSEFFVIIHPSLKEMYELLVRQKSLIEQVDFGFLKQSKELEETKTEEILQNSQKFARDHSIKLSINRRQFLKVSGLAVMLLVAKGAMGSTMMEMVSPSLNQYISQKAKENKISISIFWKDGMDDILKWLKKHWNAESEETIKSHIEELVREAIHFAFAYYGSHLLNQEVVVTLGEKRNTISDSYDTQDDMNLIRPVYRWIKDKFVMPDPKRKYENLKTVSVANYNVTLNTLNFTKYAIDALIRKGPELISFYSTCMHETIHYIDYNTNPDKRANKTLAVGYIDGTTRAQYLAEIDYRWDIADPFTNFTEINAYSNCLKWMELLIRKSYLDDNQINMAKYEIDNCKHFIKVVKAGKYSPSENARMYSVMSYNSALPKEARKVRDIIKKEYAKHHKQMTLHKMEIEEIVRSFSYPLEKLRKTPSISKGLDILKKRGYIKIKEGTIQLEYTKSIQFAWLT